MSSKTEFEVSIVGQDDGLCATRAAASYRVDTEQKARAEVNAARAAGLSAYYEEVPACDRN
ncbi:MAG: hypothetical protein GWN84_05255 [Gammaproteobacteria bacterium]|nr:hypothetical protein [Gammaproteobacteria bacterium]NIR82369.1 hypothetical protein [Gammaproteobacteria bacterium]NIU03514.1 hypothetical protein [Gammaproteobacteria bacterium]NIX84788.1 hypothetical protein [Gammaproteobacteria bacterium]